MREGSVGKSGSVLIIRDCFTIGEGKAIKNAVKETDKRIPVVHHRCQWTVKKKENKKWTLFGALRYAFR